MTSMRMLLLWLRHQPGRQLGDRGGVSDETAMIGLMLVAAVGVGAIIYSLATGAAKNLDFGF